MARTGFRADRLSAGDWLNAVASLALLVVLFALPWFGYRAAFAGFIQSTRGVFGAGVLHSYEANGWQTFSVIGPLVLLVCVLGLAAWWLGATRGSPAVPVALTVLQGPFAIALVVCLIVRVLIDPPAVLLAGASGGNALVARPAAYVGLGLSVAILAGVYLALRREGIAAGDAVAGGDIEMLDVPAERGR